MKNAALCLLLAALAALLVLRFQDVPPAPIPAPLPLPDTAAVEPAGSELVKIFHDARQDPAFAGTALGFCLLDSGGEVLFESHGSTAFIPASTLKTLTTATALETWGPDFRISTVLGATVPLKDGEIAGDLVIQGGGDPMLAIGDLESWAQTLKDQGLQRITGRIIGDGSLFPGSIYGDFWNWGDIGNGYGSGVAGLNLEHNRCTLGFVAGGQVGDAATFAGTDPEVPGVQWVNAVTTGEAGSGDGVMIHGGEHAHRMHLRGTVPLGAAEFTVRAAVPDPELYAAHHLRAALLRAGIAVGGEAVSGQSLVALGQEVPAAATELLKHSSPPLLDIVTSIHASSDNHETECLYRLLGLHSQAAPDAAVRRHWQARGLVFEGLRMEDGCGLARADFIRPLDLARLQHLAGQGPQGALYRESLLAYAGGSIRWKGGAMSGVRSYTGFVKGASGAEYSFAFMVNHFTDSKAVNALREAVVAAMKSL